MDMKSKVSPPPDEEETKAVLGYPPKQPPPLPHHHYPGYPLPAPYHPHPGYPPPYAAGPPGYPNMGNEYHHQYPPSMPNYYQPPPHPGYYNSAQMPPHLDYEPRRNLIIARVILCLLVFLILGTAAMCVLTYIIFGSAVPFFDVAAFAVPSFNISDTSLSGKWEATFTVENPNHGVDVMFERAEAIVYYNDFLLANNVVEPFELKKSGKATLLARLSTPATRHDDDAGEPPLKEMKSEHDGNGNLTFRLALDVLVSFKAGSDLSRRLTFTVICYGLKTHFKDPGVGVWDGVKPRCTLIF